MAPVNEARAIKSLQPFIETIARMYRSWGIPLEDLMQAGSIGALSAIRKWNPEGAGSLRTFADLFIKSEMRKLIGVTRKGKLVGRVTDASLDAVDGEDESTLHEILSSTAPSPEEECIAGQERARLAAAIETLEETQREVMKLSLASEEPTFENIGARIGRSPQRAQQRYRSAFTSLAKRMKASERVAA